ncbi:MULTISPECIES: tyrosine-type recombinase/integrase [unclassified Pseudoclavibacter]|uniref:tyrosine-type recombinase/integrase n=1 Tax=unclassified Pseudoclavibacter TaxID=2615177 RepID=UPI001BABFDF1|nr:tyrosine-type recombinase/integrase [Pseudoclavibacter sp. Marseille-Q4354]MBS3177257.1 tyrosine-type recombinase/integrase [Pseudoclavibacter sp. Marseille-Q4354]
MKDKFTSYRQYLFAGQKAPGTIAQRVGDLQRFERSTGSEIEDATPEILLEYMADHYAIWAPQYCKRIRSSFRSYFQWRAMTLPGQIDASRDLPSVKIPKKRHRRPAPDDLVLDAFDKATLRERAILALAATMGLRRIEIATLQLSARSDRELTVVGKGQRERVLILDDITLHLLRSIEAETAPGVRYYFPGRWAGSHLHPQTVYVYVKRMMPHECLHTLRHRAGTTGYTRTLDIRATQEFLGHSSLATTEIYVELDRRSTAAITEATSFANARDPDTSEPLDKLLSQATHLAGKLAQHGWNIDIIKSTIPVREEMAG